jgi:hypothetical protein
MPLEFGCEHRLIDEPVLMHAVQINDDESVRISLHWLEDIAPVTAKLDGYPGHSSWFQISGSKFDSNASIVVPLQLLEYPP